MKKSKKGALNTSEAETIGEYNHRYIVGNSTGSDKGATDKLGHKHTNQASGCSESGATSKK